MKTKIKNKLEQFKTWFITNRDKFAEWVSKHPMLRNIIFFFLFWIVFLPILFVKAIFHAISEASTEVYDEIKYIVNNMSNWTPNK